jgi:hypothetical protein
LIVVGSFLKLCKPYHRICVFTPSLLNGYRYVSTLCVNGIGITESYSLLEFQSPDLLAYVYTLEVILGVTERRTYYDIYRLHILEGSKLKELIEGVPTFHPLLQR